VSRRRTAVIIGAVATAAAGVGAGVAVAAGSGSSSPGMMGTGGSMTSYYQSVMKNYQGNPMMGGPAGGVSYGWMMGGTTAPGWMRGGMLPASMMGASTDAGEVTGRLFANAPGPRVSAAEAASLGNDVPAGSAVDRARDRITFPGATDHFVVLAGPSGGPGETFRVAGLVNPAITVQSGARVTIEVVNADPGAAQGLVVTASGSASAQVPMTTAVPAFRGSAVWFLGNPTSAGMHSGTLTFTAGKPGTYQYLCPVPGHAKDGMAGTFVTQSIHARNT
jgi:plastocyanin